jgi:hypothetical protein
VKLELTKKDNQILTSTNEQNDRIRKLLSKMDEAMTMAEQNNTLTKEQNTKIVELKEHLTKSIPARIQEMKTEILNSNEEFKDEIQDTTDALLRTILDKFEINILTEVSKIVSNMQIPTHTIDLTPLENNIIVAINKHEADNKELFDKMVGLISKDVKEHIDATPKQTTESPNLDAFYDKIMLEFDKKLERQSDLMNKRFDSYNEKMELLMKVKETITSKPEDIIKDTDDELLPKKSKSVDSEKPIITPTRSKDILTSNQKKVDDFLKKNPHQFPKAISENVEIAPGNLSPILKAMVNMPFIIKNKDGIL